MEYKMITHKPYQEELDEMKARMIKSQELAERFPCFEKNILNNKTQENGNHYSLGDKYKNLYLGWGVNVVRYDATNAEQQKRYMTNFTGEHDGGMFVNIYINTYSLYDSHVQYGLEELAKEVFYYDKSNSTFYIEPDKLCAFMPKLLDWYDNAIKENCKESKELEKQRLKDKLEALENTECK